MSTRGRLTRAKLLPSSPKAPPLCRTPRNPAGCCYMITA
jgi:hypothetical protein